MIRREIRGDEGWKVVDGEMNETGNRTGRQNDFNLIYDITGDYLLAGYVGGRRCTRRASVYKPNSTSIVNIHVGME